MPSATKVFVTDPTCILVVAVMGRAPYNSAYPAPPVCALPASIVAHDTPGKDSSSRMLSSRSGVAVLASIAVRNSPVSALDVSVQAQVLNLLADLRSTFDLTYLFISHDLAVVEAVSDRIAVLYFGSLVEIGPAEAVFAAPRHPYTKLLADSAPVVGRPLTPPEAEGMELPDPLNPPKGCAFAARCPSATDICRKETPHLSPIGTASEVACFHPRSA